MAAAKQKRETLNLRIRAEDRGLIDRAAAADGKNRTDFILEAARRAANETLLDRVLLSVDEAAYSAFVARLDATQHPNERLTKSLAVRPAWRAP
jgi:uncharacterized protein (DUF1778 family)